MPSVSLVFSGRNVDITRGDDVGPTLIREASILILACDRLG
jgi:hypothetical protein